MNVFALGASKNIGYFAAIRLLSARSLIFYNDLHAETLSDKGATVTFLLRNTSVFDADESIQPFVRSGKARLVKGDALNIDDVARGWAEAQAASEAQHVDVLLFSVGQSSPRFISPPHNADPVAGGVPESFHWRKGAQIKPANLCSACLLNVVRTLPANQRTPGAQPRCVVVTSTGITKGSHDGLPLAMKGLYSYLLDGPHVDKFGMERLLAHCAGAPFARDAYRADLLPPRWQALDGVPAPGALPTVLVVRPAWLTDGPAKADEPAQKRAAPYKVQRGDDAKLGWTISRRDVAHFIVERGLANWDEWQGQVVSLSY